jgi:prophage regulatory protein
MPELLQLVAPVHRLIRRKRVEELCAISRSTIYNKLDTKSPQYDPDFPAPIHIGARRVAWLESEVQAYIEFCVSSSRAHTEQAVLSPQDRKNPCKIRSPRKGIFATQQSSVHLSTRIGGQ